MSIAWQVKDYAFEWGCIQLLGTALFIFGHKYYKNLQGIQQLSKKMESMPRAKIAEADAGYIEVEGKIEDIDNALISPLSQQRCVFWEIRVVANGSIIRIENSRQPFLINDGSDVALVCPNKRSKLLTATGTGESAEWSQEIYRRNPDFWKSLKIDPSSQNLTIVENLIVATDDIYINANCFAAPGRFSRLISRELAKLNTAGVVNALTKKGYIFPQENPEMPVTVDGNSLLSLDAIIDNAISPSKTMKHSKYLYGSNERQMFISTVTETMINNQQPIDLYDVSPTSIAFLSGSIMLFFLGVLSLFI